MSEKPNAIQNTACRPNIRDLANNSVVLHAVAKAERMAKHQASAERRVVAGVTFNATKA